MISSYLAIDAHDPIIARDGRPFGAAQGNRMKSLEWPYPSVLAGSLRTMLGRIGGIDFVDETIKALKLVKIYGPLPFYKDEIYLPAPKDILVKDDAGGRETYSIRPARMKNGEGCNLPTGDILPAMLPESVKEEFKPSKIPIFWSLSKMVEWLVDSTGSSFGAPPDPDKIEKATGFLSAPKKESRVHVKIDPKLGASEEGFLFETMGLDLSLKGENERVMLTARIEADITFEDLVKKINSFSTFGGERRLVRWKQVDIQDSWSCPERIISALDGKNRVRMVLATPAIFSQGWLPGWLQNEGGSILGHPPAAPDGLVLKLVSACIDRWKPVSGWNLENKNRGPKPIKRLVNAGSVYFFELMPGGDAKELAKELWLKPVSDVDQDQQDGFGLALWGTWKFSDGIMNDKKEGTKLEGV
ncbi:MAG: type III-B CRISPR module-associated protein Cmr3 [Methanotrichaceae archaeon]